MLESVHTIIHSPKVDLGGVYIAKKIVESSASGHTQYIQENHRSLYAWGSCLLTHTDRD